MGQDGSRGIISQLGFPGERVVEDRWGSGNVIPG